MKATHSWAAAIAALLFVIISLSPASAESASDKREFICPIGGKPFTHNVGYSAFPLITMSDGSWLGDTEIGVQIPVCPDNGLVLLPDLAASDHDKINYLTYSPQDIATLPALIADPEYSALKADGPYAQAYWLATKLGRPAEDRFFMLQRSTWATRDPALRKRLVARLANDGMAVIAGYKLPERTKRFHATYVANALRELGRFDEALALLDRIETSGPPVLEPQDPDSIFGPEEVAPQLREAIAEKDDGRFPAAMLHRRMVNDICENKLATLYGPTTPATLRACKLRSDRQAQAQADSDESFRLQSDPVGLSRKCDATPAAARKAALSMACDSLQIGRDSAEGGKMANNGPALAAACDATPEAERQGVLRYGCINYDSALGLALGNLLPDDPVAYDLFCPGNGDAYPEDRAEFATNACGTATRTLAQREEERLLTDPDSLGKRCAKSDDESGDDARYAILLSACSTLERNRNDAAIAALANDNAAFDKNCGGFAKTNSAGNNISGLAGEQQQCQRAWRLRENTKVRVAAEAKGLKCFHDVIYSPDRPKCVSPAAYDREMAVGRDDPKSMKMDVSYLNDGSSLMIEASKRAAAMIAATKASGSYPKSAAGDASDF